MDTCFAANQRAAVAQRAGLARAAVVGVLVWTWGAAHAADGRETVNFKASDGHAITADLYRPRTREAGPAPFVLLLHMYRSDRTAWEPLIPPLQEAGFVVLALDLRGHGDSATTETREQVARRDPAVFQKMQGDVRGAYDYLATLSEVDRSRFAIVGASVGVSIALQYAAKDRSVDAIVGLSPGLNYMGIDSVGDIRQIKGRKVLLVAAPAESDAPLTLKSQGHDVETEILKDARGHGTELLTESPTLVRKIVEAVQAGVGKPAEHLVYGTINSDIYHEPDSAWVKEISATNLRHYSSPAEAQARGLREARSKGPNDRKPPGPGRDRKP